MVVVISTCVTDLITHAENRTQYCFCLLLLIAIILFASYGIFKTLSTDPQNNIDFNKTLECIKEYYKYNLDEAMNAQMRAQENRRG